VDDGCGCHSRNKLHWVEADREMNHPVAQQDRMGIACSTGDVFRSSGKNV
jgi:hypothetical protein